MPKEVITLKLGPRPAGDYSQGWSVTGSRLIFLSGQVSVDKDGNFVGIGDIAKQTETVLENLQKVLQDAGASLKDVIKINIYVTEMVEFQKKTREIRRKYFPNNFPASTLVEVKSLARPELMVEIEAVAAVE
jgi:2-iminobutanoate/2-iminopropanoate deaminase